MPVNRNVYSLRLRFSVNRFCLQRLADHIEGSRAGRLAEDSNNVVKLIRDNYKDISSEVKMVAETDAEDVTIKFFSK
jgi:hypothetical protein